jgi:glycosyltransferase involved in cell wall biosynthesis
MMMRVVFLSQYFIPEIFSSTYLFYDLLLASKEKNNENIIIAPFPIRGVSKSQIEKFSIAYEENEYGKIYRFKCFTGFKNSFFGRFLRMLSLVRKEIKILNKLGQVDKIVIPSTPPLFLLRAVSRFAKKRNTELIYHIHDLYPDILFKPKSLFYRPLNIILMKALKRVDNIVVISMDIRNSLLKKGIPSAKIHVIPNWPRVQSKLPDEEDYDLQTLKKKIEFDSSKVNAFYIGNLGVFQDMGVIVKAAKRINETDNQVKISIVGSGSKQKQLFKLLKKHHLKNIAFYPRVSQEEAEWLYLLADYNLISLQKGAIFSACPSKTSMCVMAQKPIILIVDEASKYADSFRKGNYVVNCGDDIHLANILSSLQKNSPFKGDSFLEEYYAKERNLALWKKLL